VLNKSAAGPRGRRPGSPDTRGLLLEIARRRFLADGYRAVTLRSIATEAGVDVALVSYFFGSKRGLFGAALDLAVNPAELLRAALPGDRATMPERVLRTLVAHWDNPDLAPRLRLVATTVVQEPELARLFRELVQREMTDRMADYLGGADAPARAAVFTTQLVGVIFARYVVGLEPVASLTPDELVRHLLPGLRAVLYAPVGPPRRR
jgi:AcrR family transcriptional regulator